METSLKEKKKHLKYEQKLLRVQTNISRKNAFAWNATYCVRCEYMFWLWIKKPVYAFYFHSYRQFRFTSSIKLLSTQTRSPLHCNVTQFSVNRISW